LSRFIKSEVSTLPASQHYPCISPCHESSVCYKPQLSRNLLCMLFIALFFLYECNQETHLCCMRYICSVDESPWIQHQGGFSVTCVSNFELNCNGTKPVMVHVLLTCSQRKSEKKYCRLAKSDTKAIWFGPAFSLGKMCSEQIYVYYEIGYNLCYTFQKWK
jgi:hypothetical protein